MERHQLLMRLVIDDGKSEVAGLMLFIAFAHVSLFS